MSQNSPTSSAFGSSDGHSAFRFAGQRDLDKAGGRLRVQTANKKQTHTQSQGGGGDDTRADALAQMIEQENQKLRLKNEKVKEQLKTKQIYVDGERQRYMEKIRQLKERRD